MQRILENEPDKIKFKFTITQLPLDLAIAQTINKAQGRTILNLMIELSEPYEKFPHYIYVVLSRLCELVGLYLRGGEC